MKNSDRAVRADAVVRRESRQLLAYFERRVEFREEAADLLSDTLLVVWRRIDALPHDDEQARMWLYGIARKIVLGYRRGSRRRSELGRRLRDEISSGVVDSSELRSELMEALDSLGEVDREIVVLTAWDGFTQAEVARHLHLRPGTVRSRYSRARSRLRRALSEPGEDDHREVAGQAHGSAARA